MDEKEIKSREKIYIVFAGGIDAMSSEQYEVLLNLERENQGVDVVIVESIKDIDKKNLSKSLFKFNHNNVEPLYEVKKIEHYENKIKPKHRQFKSWERPYKFHK